MFPGWGRWFAILGYPRVSIFREILASKARLLFRCAFTPKAQTREKCEKSMENCHSTVFWPEWSQIPTPLFLWLESCGCHHSHFVLPAYPFYLPSPSRRVTLPPLHLPWWVDGSCRVCTCWTHEGSGHLSNNTTQKCSKLWLNKRLKREAVCTSIFDPSTSWKDSFWRQEFPHILSGDTLID